MNRARVAVEVRCHACRRLVGYVTDEKPGEVMVTYLVRRSAKDRRHQVEALPPRPSMEQAVDALGAELSTTCAPDELGRLQSRAGHCPHHDRCFVQPAALAAAYQEHRETNRVIGIRAATAWRTRPSGSGLVSN